MKIEAAEEQNRIASDPKEIISSQAPQAGPIKVATHSFRQQYLFAFATQAEVLQYVRTQTLPEETLRLQEIFSMWKSIQPRVEEVICKENGLADTIELKEIPAVHEKKVAAFFTDPLFQRTFSQLRVAAGLIEIDKLVAAQRTVNLDYIDRLVASYPSNPEIDQLLDICISPKRSMEPIQHLEVAPNTHVLSSPNADLRFLGAFFKPLSPEDLEHAVHGGIPVAGVMAFVGYGAAPVNVFVHKNRVVLNNGFHRVYALRSMGVREIPVVIQHVARPEFEFPPQVAGLPREYLLGAERPVLMKDFFEEGFVVPLRVRERLKMITISIGLNQHEVPA